MITKKLMALVILVSCSLSLKAGHIRNGYFPRVTQLEREQEAERLREVQEESALRRREETRPISRYPRNPQTGQPASQVPAFVIPE